MLCIWWDQLGVVYYELLQSNETMGNAINNNWCNCRVLKQKRPDYEKRHDKLIFQYDNARSYVAKPIKETLEVLNWNVLSHPPYYPDVAPSDYHLFRSMTHGLSEQRFYSCEDTKKWVDSWIASKNVFFRHEIPLLPKRWKKVAINNILNN